MSIVPIRPTAPTVKCVLWSLETRLGIWRQSCDQLVTLLDEYSRTLLSNLQKFQELKDTRGAEMISASCVNCLAYLAVLCETLSRMEPTPQTRLDTLCDSTLEKLSGLARDMYMEEYTLLDLLLMVRVPTSDGQTNTADCERRADVLEKGAGSFRSSSRSCPSRTRHTVTALEGKEGNRRKGPFEFCGEASGRRTSNSCHPRKLGGQSCRRIAVPESDVSWVK